MILLTIDLVHVSNVNFFDKPKSRPRRWKERMIINGKKTRRRFNPWQLEMSTWYPSYRDRLGRHTKDIIQVGIILIDVLIQDLWKCPQNPYPKSFEILSGPFWPFSIPETHLDSGYRMYFFFFFRPRSFFYLLGDHMAAMLRYYGNRTICMWCNNNI